MAEYNTRYFPKLCLEEEPSVDMTAHRPRLSEGQTSTPLNDNQLFALEQAKFRAELEAFTWSRDEGETGESASEVDLSVDLESHESISGCSSAKERNGVALGPNELERVVELPVNEATPRVANPEWLQEEGGKTSRAPAEFSETSGPQAGSDESATPADSSSSTSVAPQGDASPTEHIASSPDSIRNASHGGIVDRGGASSTVTIPFVSGSSYDNGTVHDLVLPTSYPASDLSVSDVVSVPSNSVGSPHRLFRRHLHLPNAETAPMARLSVELNGTITILDDEEWEELSSEGIGSLPNGPTPRSGPSTFLTRGFGEILRRQPSTLVTTGLRRQPKTSDSSPESSPTKFRPLLNPGSFASRSVEGTKKALGRLKTFPKLRKAGEGGEGEIAPVAAKSPTGNVESTAGSAIKPRPSDTHRHTESGTDGFDKRPRLPKHGLTSTPRVCKQSGSSSNPSTGEGPVPRVELTSTPPVVW